MKSNKLTFKDIYIIFAVVLSGLVLLAGLILLNWRVASRNGIGEDILPSWNGSRAFLFENTDPYTRTVAERTQILYYGRAAQEGEFPFFLDLPFPLLVFFFPLAFIKDPYWVRAVWMTISEMGLMLLSSSALYLANWRPSRWFNILILVFSLAWIYSVVAILEGSFSGLLVLILVGALLAMRGYKDELAGFLLAISVIKWETTLLLWLLIVIGAFTTRRWRIFAGLGMTWLVLGAISFLIYPNWFWPFLRAVTSNWREGSFLFPNLILEEWFPGFGKGMALLLVSILLLVLAVEWFSSLRSKDFRRIAWAVALAVAITPLIGFPVEIANIATLLFPIALTLPFIWERWQKRPYFVITLLIIFLFAIPLFLKWWDFSGRSSTSGWILLSPSLFIILCLYWVRWTLIRPPRTWLDGVKRELGK